VSGSFDKLAQHQNTRSGQRLCSRQELETALTSALSRATFYTGEEGISFVGALLESMEERKTLSFEIIFETL